MKLLSIIFLTLASFLHAEETPKAPAMTEAQAIERLSKIDTFGFGPARGQVERESDTAFRILLSQPKPKETFASLFEKGGTAAKLYALCALNSIEPEAFTKLSGKMKPDEMIMTQFGCIVGETKVGEIIKDISDGNYDEQVKFFTKD